MNFLNYISSTFRPCWFNCNTMIQRIKHQSIVLVRPTSDVKESIIHDMSKVAIE